jgi:hypothetical protein
VDWRAVIMQTVDGRRAFPWPETPLFVSWQADHHGQSVCTRGPSLTWQEFAEECDTTAYGRCLRPALYSSLRSSPSHPAGVSALRVTIAIANARFARKSPRVSRVFWLGSWALGTSGRGGQDKARKVRAIGRDGEHREIPAIWQTLRSSKRTFRISATRSCPSTSDTA